MIWMYLRNTTFYYINLLDESTKVLSICSSKTSTWVICSDNRIFASRAGHTHSTERIFEWVEVTPPNQAEHELIDQVTFKKPGISLIVQFLTIIEKITYLDKF